MQATETKTPTQLELKTRELFNDYFCSVKNDALAFGISASKLCSKIESLSAYIPDEGIEGLLKVEFDDLVKKRPDYVNLSRRVEDNGIALNMNRKYNGGYSLAGFGVTAKACCEDKTFDIVTASSEIARNVNSSIYDFVVRITDKSSGDEVLVKEKYALANRLRNVPFALSFLTDLKSYLRSHKEAKISEVRDLLKEDESRHGIYFADTKKREITDKEFALIPECLGFKIWYGTDKPWDWHNFYHDSYENNCNVNQNIANIFQGLYEQDVYNILHHEGDIKNKLDICMMIFKNKQELEKAHPVDKVIV